MQRTGRFDPCAGGGTSRPFRRFNQHAANPVATVHLLDDEGGDATPRTIVVRYGHEETRRGPDERLAVVSNEHLSPRISQHALQPIAERGVGLRMAQLVEQPSQLPDVLKTS